MTKMLKTIIQQSNIYTVYVRSAWSSASFCEISSASCLLNVKPFSFIDLLTFENTQTQAESQLHSLEQAAEDIGLYVNTNKIDLNEKGPFPL